MKTYKKEEFDNSTQRPEGQALGKVKGIKKGILINIDKEDIPKAKRDCVKNNIIWHSGKWIISYG